MSLALAHALELPGKLRLSREEYLAVQAIYYPGFTIGGAAEPLAIIALGVFFFFSPGNGARFLIGAALAAAVGTQILFWTVVQPVNRHWLRAIRLGRAGERFFNASVPAPEAHNWIRLRDRWESGHLARSVTATAAFVLTISALIAS